MVLTTTDARYIIVLGILISVLPISSTTPGDGCQEIDWEKSQT
jgi:hypothetical protein